MRVISFEGIDACGKTTTMKLLKTALIDAGKKVAEVKLPRRDRPIGKIIYDCLEGRIHLDKMVLHALYELDRLEYNSSIAELEREGYDYLLCDRHYMSNLAFFSSKTDNKDDLDWLSSVGSMDRKPELNFIIDIPVEESFHRRPERRDKHETDKELLERVRNNYLRIANEINSSADVTCVVLDGTNPTTAIVAQILFILFNEFN